MPGHDILALRLPRRERFPVPHAAEVAGRRVDADVFGQQAEIDRLILEGVEHALAPRLRGPAHIVIRADVAVAHGVAYRLFEVLAAHGDARLLHLGIDRVMCAHGVDHAGVIGRPGQRFGRSAKRPALVVHRLIEGVFGNPAEHFLRTTPVLSLRPAGKSTLHACSVGSAARHR